MVNKLIAREGYIFTNGDAYGTEIYLGEGVDADSFYEIPIEEYKAKMDELEPVPFA